MSDRVSAGQGETCREDWRCECGDLNRWHESFCFRCGACQPEEDAVADVLVLRPEVCGNCQAADDSIYWNATGGWSCRSCGASDYEEAAE